MEVLVLFNYDGQAEDELTIRKGDVILDVKKLEGGWWEGLLGSKRGLFPDNFVMVVTEAEMNHSLPSAIVRTEKGRKCKALFSYTPSHEDELELLVGDEIHFLGEVEEGWWRGKLAGRIGVFPSNFVVLEDIQPNLVTKPSDAAPELPPKPLKELARVLFPYSSLQPDELELKEGDLVIIHSKDCEDKGWWKGEINNKIGVFPDNFVEIIPHTANNSGLKSGQQTSTVQSPQVRSGGTVSKNDPSSPSSAFSSESDHQVGNFSAASTTKSAGAHATPNISLSDEQKLQQVGEADNFHDITPTESLAHITASRVRPTKRRPPSALFFKDSEIDGSNGTFSIPPATVGGLAVHTEEPDQNKLSLVEHNLRPVAPLTKTRTSSVKLPWMEELKRNQEKKGTHTTSGSHEKPLIPPAKPTVPKHIQSPIVVPNNQTNLQSEGNSVTSLGEPVLKKIGQKNTKLVEQPVSLNVSPKTPENQFTKSPTNTSGSTDLVPVLPAEKKTLKESPTGPPSVDVKKLVLESGMSTSPKESVVSDPGLGETPKPKSSPGLPSTVTKPQIESPKHQPPVNDNELVHVGNSDATVQHELRSLHLRVASLEATVRSLQAELLQLKNTHAEEHRCPCMKKADINEASLVHI